MVILRSVAAADAGAESTTRGRVDSRRIEVARSGVIITDTVRRCGVKVT
jgi:hypothetical protein